MIFFTHTDGDIEIRLEREEAEEFLKMLELLKAFLSGLSIELEQGKKREGDPPTL